LLWKASLVIPRQYNDPMELKSLQITCSRDCGLQPGRLVVVGVSGGADSLALADALAALGYPLVIAHYDHGLRVDSSADLEFVRNYAASKGQAFITASGDVASHANTHGLSTEEAARQMRYAFLFRVTREQSAQALAVGHTADDQVETVLMHLLRGAGLDGLKGMTWRGMLASFDQDVPLVRPLLGVWRTETEAWCQAHALAYRVDITNRDTAYARNRLRHEIIPMLESYNPQAKTHIQQLAGHLAGDHRLLAGLTDAAFHSSLKESGDGYLVFDRKQLASLDPALGARILRQTANRLVAELRDFDSGAVERCLAAIPGTPAGWQADLPGGLRIHLDGDQAILFTWQADLPGMDWPQIPGDQVFDIKPPCELTLDNGWLLRLEEISPAPSLSMVMENQDPRQAWIDADRLTAGLSVHRASVGQRFIPLGMITGSQKLSDFWVNVRLPQRARAGWPVVFSGNEVVWLPGFRPAHTFRVTPGTKRTLVLQLARQPEQ
jgi:tRNA(Ile)-lysidine synthase